MDHKRSCRILIQQCTKATLNSDEKEFEPLELGKGMVVFVCFFKDATEKVIELIVSTILNVKLSEPDDADAAASLQDGLVGKRVKILDMERRWDILLVPQATLGGKLKGTAIQYHGNVDKAEGLKLFSKLTASLKESYEMRKASSCGAVVAGKYGARQILAMETNGPYSHVFDL